MSPGAMTLSPTQPEVALYRKYRVYHKKQTIIKIVSLPNCAEFL